MTNFLNICYNDKSEETGASSGLIFMIRVITIMGRNQYLEQHRYSRRRKRQVMFLLPYIILSAILVILLCIAGYLYLRNKNLASWGAVSPEVQAQGPDSPDPAGPAPSEQGTAENESTAPSTPEDVRQTLLVQADLLAAGYDYDAAIELLNSSAYQADEQVAAAVAEYEQIKTTLIRQDPHKITHVFFHTLIMDTSLAFDGDSREKGYNQMMTTKEEFVKILQSMYDRGFVLVRLHDVAYEAQQEDGSVKFTGGNILLPPGKQAFVMSEDDVCYYEYMEGDGFATKMIIGEDGKPTCEMKMPDGSIAVGAFDLVPLLEEFIAEHPDFSYKGARAVIAFTGYNGILGYRTAASYNSDEYKQKNPDFDYEKEREEAAKVAQCLKDNGYELASHSWGHRNMGTISMEHFIIDTDKWENEVETLIGECDTILFPFGSDIGDWRADSYSNNERFDYLHSKGFRYFCNVDSSQYWVQIGDDYMRQGRRNLDGFRMFYDLPETNPTKDHLSDLFDVSEVFDRRRPTPVAKMSE